MPTVNAPHGSNDCSPMRAPLRHDNDGDDPSWALGCEAALPWLTQTIGTEADTRPWDSLPAA